VDIGGLDSDSPAVRAGVARALDDAAQSAGFLYVTGHGVPEDSTTALVAQAAAFFAMSDDAKQRYHIGKSSNHRGYVHPGEEVFYGQSKDTKEAFDLALDLPANDPDFVAGNRLLGPNVWPHELPEFKPVVSSYHSRALALGRRLLRGFALALGLPEAHFDALVQKPPSQLRLLHYPGGGARDAGAMGIGSHTDYECFTILHTTGPGLEVMNAEGEWIDAPPLPSAFVVNIGDLLEVLTNGRWVSTTHRVRPVQSERYSFPLFFCLDYHTVVEPLAAFVPPSEAPRYGRLVAGEHLLAQTAQSFGYLKALVAAGALRLPEASLGLSSFGRDRATAEGR